MNSEYAASLRTEMTAYFELCIMITITSKNQYGAVVKDTFAVTAHKNKYGSTPFYVWRHSAHDSGMLFAGEENTCMFEKDNKISVFSTPKDSINFGKLHPFLQEYLKHNLYFILENAPLYEWSDRDHW
jgi:hypothetical protein